MFTLFFRLWEEFSQKRMIGKALYNSGMIKPSNTCQVHTYPGVNKS
ncbi:hypothetical protein BEI_2419 [Halomonas beimenensis]|uniref:Uncharacterized protein n=1 Tax=Halomonas beimenensis TaxID=475662 RepID=A0A291P912_9GAMM|nr:hypothetical protein BEI_2419 [Halomonas beimenensis]